MKDLVVIIPVYNEELSILDTLNSVVCVLREHKELLDVCVYVYNNNSTDNTVQIVNSFIGDNTAINVVLKNCYRQGKGYVIKQAFSELDAKCYCIIDGDDTYDTTNLYSMYRMIIDNHMDMVIGDRLSSTYFDENKRLFHNFGNRLMRYSINKLFHMHYNDILSGFRMFSYKFVKTFPITSTGFSIETEMNIHAANYDLFVSDVEVKYQDRKDGSVSKLNTFSDGFKVINKLLEMLWLYRPMLFYNTLAIFFISIGVFFIIPIVDEFCLTGYVPKFPTLIVACFSVMIGILSIFIGQIQASNSLRQKQNFELMSIEKERDVYEDR